MAEIANTDQSVIMIQQQTRSYIMKCGLIS
jgi:hypothetical protein